MSLQLIDTATGEIINERTPAMAWHSRQLRSRARQRSKKRLRVQRAVWPHLAIALVATVLIVGLAVL